MSQRTETIEDRSGREANAVGRAGVVVVFSEAEPPGEGVYSVRGGLCIGRDRSCGVFVDDRRLSQHHATLLWRAGELVVTDAGSRDGTRLNGQPVGGPTPISHGDVLRCGQSVLLCVQDIARFGAWRRQAAGLMVGGPRIQQLLSELLAFAGTSLGVLIVGESGTERDRAARILHEASGRPGEFVALDCAAISEGLFEAELLGVARGAFATVGRERPGALRSADGGTLFVDEIGELPARQQAQLLRAMERQEVCPVGGSQALRADVRVVAATHRSLRRDVQSGRLRPDLYHRLRGGTVAIPPLRARREDIVLLVEGLLRGAGDRVSSQPPALLSASFMEALLNYDWPGNVRELKSTFDDALMRAIAESSEKLLLRHLRRDVVEGSRRNVQLVVLKDALSRFRGNVSRVAAELGVHRTRVFTMLRQYGISTEEFR